MAVVVLIIMAVAAGFALILVVFAVVVICIHTEERRSTIVRERGRAVYLTGEPPPTISALLARRMLGAHFTGELHDMARHSRPPRSRSWPSGSRHP